QAWYHPGYGGPALLRVESPAEIPPTPVLPPRGGPGIEGLAEDLVMDGPGLFGTHRLPEAHEKTGEIGHARRPGITKAQQQILVPEQAKEADAAIARGGILPRRHLHADPAEGGRQLE